MWKCNTTCNSINKLFAVLPSMFPWRHIPCAVLSSLPYGSAPFMIVAVYFISDGHSIFRSSLNWLHHTPKNRNSRIISMVENSRKNAPFFPIGKTGPTVILYVIMVKYLHQEDAYEKSIINTRKIRRFKKRT